MFQQQQMEPSKFLANNHFHDYCGFQSPPCASLLSNSHSLHSALLLLQAQYSQLLEQHHSLLQKYQQLETAQKAHPSHQLPKKRSRRRVQSQLVRTYRCPYESCQKDYASEFALNLHLRNKHEGGSKRERDARAKVLLKCQKEGRQPPKSRVSLPPGYLQRNRIRLMLMDSDESGSVKQEQ